MNKIKFLIISLCIIFICGCEITNEATAGWIVDSGAPNGVVEAANGDFYLDTNTFNLYQMINDSWSQLGNIAGAKGEDGKDSKIDVSENGYLIVNGKTTEIKIVGNAGKDGIDGTNGVDGKDGENGKDGKDGKDGSSPKVTIGTDGYIMIDSVKLNLKKYNSTCTLVVDNDEDRQADIGDMITCGSESFYVIFNDGTTVHMLAKWNLDVGDIYDGDTKETRPIENPTGLQKEEAKGYIQDSGLRYGVVAFAFEPYWDNGNIKGIYNDKYPGFVYDSNSNIFNYLQEYKSKLSDMGAMVEKIRLTTVDEVRALGCVRRLSSCADTEYDWLITSSYWTGSADNSTHVWRVNVGGYFTNYDVTVGRSLGVRPVIEVLDDNIIR